MPYRNRDVPCRNAYTRQKSISIGTHAICIRYLESLDCPPSMVFSARAWVRFVLLSLASSLPPHASLHSDSDYFLGGRFSIVVRVLLASDKIKQRVLLQILFFFFLHYNTHVEKIRPSHDNKII